MGWVAYAAAWVAMAVSWALASAQTGRVSPLETLPFGLIAMGSAATMGVGVWHLTKYVAWDWRAPKFYIVHGIALVVFTLGYATSWTWMDLFTRPDNPAFQELRWSSVVFWNLMMGSWLYLIVAGLSYAVRAHRRVRDQEAAAAEARLLTQQAQLTALRAQINPHFLFNALHSVAALVAIDPPRAEEALERLGDLLRYALGTEHQVPLSHEWRFTQDYLALEQLRLGDRLKVESAFGKDALPVMVPPLILQPLVENAVRHGIADRPEGGAIRIRATVDGDRLVLAINDDGAGGASMAREGLGLGSVRRRLATLYGSRAGVDIDTGAGGFAVTLWLPLEPADDLPAFAETAGQGSAA